MDNELIEALVEFFSKKYPKTKLTFTGHSFLVEGDDKDYIILEIQGLVTGLTKEHLFIN